MLNEVPFWKLVAAIIVALLILSLGGLVAAETISHTNPHPQATTTFTPD